MNTSNRMTIELISDKTDEQATILLVYGELEIATMIINMVDDRTVITMLDMIAKIEECPFILNTLHANEIMLTTLFAAWEDEHETIASVFNDGNKEIVVNPVLYRGEACNDSETKQVICPNCGNKFDSELPHWLAGDEECPECDHVFHVDSVAVQS